MKREIGLAAVLAIRTLAEPPDFSRYAFIIERQPFGQPPAVAPAAPPTESPLTSLRVSALWVDGEGRARVGLVDEKNQRSYLLAVGETENDIEVVSVDPAEETATVRSGPHQMTLRLAGTTAPVTPTVAGGPARGATVGAPPRMGLMRGPPRGWLRRAQEASAQAGPVEGSGEGPPLGRGPPPTPEEVERRLQEYQMEALRRGLPPLPIPLTPEMDEQLVREGVLPPQ